MKRELLIRIGVALYGPRFQRELAAALGVNERTVRRWVAGDTSTPATIENDLRKLVQERSAMLARLL